MWAPNLAYSRQLKQNNSLIHSLPQRAKPTTMKAWIIFKQNETMSLSFFSRFYIWFQWKYWQINSLFISTSKVVLLVFYYVISNNKELIYFSLNLCRSICTSSCWLCNIIFLIKSHFRVMCSPLMHLLLWDSNKVNTFSLLGSSKFIKVQIKLKMWAFIMPRFKILVK